MGSPERSAPLPTVARGARPAAVLVTGVPRSGTTWLARELARTRGSGLAGREPMNPRGGQFALGGTLSTWVELEDPTPRQRRLLRRCYRGREPRVMSRYGERQLRAALPWSTTVVKDPFALLSLPAVVRFTGALPVVVYRPASAVLASYRRMGWRPDTAELRALPGGPTGPAPADDVTGMVEFWNHLHQRLLERLPELGDAVVVSHAELSAGGAPALDALARRCGLGERLPGRAPVAAKGGARLHDFDRSAAEVAEGWRSRVSPEERDRADGGTAEVLGRLDHVRWRWDG